MKKTMAWLTGLFTVLAFLGTDGLAMEERWAQVEAAVDGDTVRLRDGSLVRYLGIDAPEIDHRNRKSEPFGEAAWNLNRQMVDGKRIRLQSGKRTHDRFGRWLAHAFDESGQLITQRILERGLACYYADSAATSRAHQSILLSAQRQAMEEKRGIWSKPLHGKGPFIGNRRSLRFHTDLCPYGQKTGRGNRTLFHSRREAHWHGFAPCRQCFGSPIKKGLKRR